MGHETAGRGFCIRLVKHLSLSQIEDLTESITVEGTVVVRPERARVLVV